MSLPSRERGLKSCITGRLQLLLQVAPLAGAWIEIFLQPFPSNGLKVAPLAGAWIEICIVIPLMAIGCSRSPRGSVD